MNSIERIHATMNNRSVDRVGFWMGQPDDQTQRRYFEYFKINSFDELSDIMGDDLMWLPADWCTYSHPQGKPMWDFTNGQPRNTIIDAGCFAECEDIKEVDSFDWPKADYLNFDSYINRLDEVRSKGKAVFGGFWTFIFQITVDFFGMENLFIKMYTNPEIVQGVIEHVVDFYLEANKRLFEKAADKIDAFFWANDLGSQHDLLISPEFFRRFYAPGFKKIVDLAKSYNLKVIMHSCGAVAKLIPDFIDIGIEGLHPLQAKAAGMQAENLAQYKNDLFFMGGVDTQELLPFGTAEEVKQDVRRLKKLLGNRIIISPSHEGVLPNISPENILAMRDAAME